MTKSKEKKNTCTYPKRKEVDNFLESTALAFNSKGVATGYNDGYNDDIIMDRFGISQSTIRGLRHDIYSLKGMTGTRGKGKNTLKINDLEERVASLETQLTVLQEQQQQHQYRLDLKVAS